MEQLIVQGDLRHIQADRDEDWDIFKAAIIQLYWAEGRELPEVMETMKTRHNFHATKKQYKGRFKKWKLNKNIGHDKMKAIVGIQKRRRKIEDKRTEFSFHEKAVLQEKIDRWLKRQESGEEEAASPYNSLTASTPSGIEYRTPASLVVSTPSTHSAQDPLSPLPVLEVLSAPSQREIELNSSPILMGSNVQLVLAIPGIVTFADKIFFEHYCNRLSAVLTIEVAGRNTFKDMLLPMATQHLGLMHSILAMSGLSIDYDLPYGRALLSKHPQLTEEDLKERAYFHQIKALMAIQEDVRRKTLGQTQQDNVLTLYAQILCLVIRTKVEGRASGEHIIHLRAYQCLIHELPPIEGPAMEIIQEYFQFHTSLVDLSSLPEGPRHLGAPNEDWNLPSLIRTKAIGLLGVGDGLFFYISRITTIRNTIRNNIQRGIDPVVDHNSLYWASEIDAGIRDWKPLLPKGNLLQDLACDLYKIMAWVYLWRTIYIPKETIWQPDYRITCVVNKAVEIFKLFPPRNQIQTLLLAPTFIIGCAAFHPSQRQPIRNSIRNIKEWTNLKNADRVVEVLQEVWRYMDAQDERSWDWQMVAHEIGVDFLVG